MTKEQTIRYIIAFVVARISGITTNDYIKDEDGNQHDFSNPQLDENKIYFSESKYGIYVDGSLSSFNIKGPVSTSVYNLRISGSSFSGQETNLGGNFNGNIGSSDVTIDNKRHSTS